MVVFWVLVKEIFAFYHEDILYFCFLKVLKVLVITFRSVIFVCNVKSGSKVFFFHCIAFVILSVLYQSNTVLIVVHLE